MATPMSPELRERFMYVLSLWNVSGYINWEDTALRFIYRELEDCTARLFGKLMYEHVCAGGKTFQVEEARPDWLDWKFHYDLYVRVNEREIYVETRFVDEKHRDDCAIYVVNVHDP